MAKIIKTLTGQADVIVTETYLDEEAANAEDAKPENVDVKVIDFKVENTRWKKEYDK